MGRYRLVRRMAAGGMADLFLAQVHGEAGYLRSVVIKTLRGDLAEEEHLTHQIVEEARIASSLHHDNIVQTLEVGQDGDTHFLAMEFVFGRTLRQVVDRCVEVGLPFPAEHALTVVRDALEALHYAHEEAEQDGTKLHLIHRDVSPSNLMLGFDGSTRLLDFGLAKGALQLTRTRAGVVKGNYAYMSPEQVQRKELDVRSDLFSLGVILWELLVGRRLFQGSNELETIRAVAQQPVPFPKFVEPSVSMGASWVAWRALQRRRSLRFASAKAMQTAVQRLDDRSIDQARDELRDWLRSVFHFELATRDAALQRTRGEPTQFRMLRDSGFEMLPEATDPGMPRLHFGPSSSGDLGRGSWLLSFSRSRWFGIVLVALVFFSIGLGVLIGRSQAPPTNVGFLYVISDQRGGVQVGRRDVGPTPAQRIPVLPGRHRVRVTVDGETREQVTRVRAGQNRLIKFDFGSSSAAEER